MDMLTAPDLADLRAALTACGYTRRGLGDLLGEAALGALDRRETTPARMRLEIVPDDAGSATDRATALRLWWLGDPCATERVRAACGPLHPLIDAGLIAVTEDRVTPQVMIQPLVDLADAGLDPTTGHAWLISDAWVDLDGAAGRVHGDLVLGDTPAARTLAGLAIAAVEELSGRAPQRPLRVLDLGTGCGVQALRLADRFASLGIAATVTATDISPRAVDLARLTGALNGHAWDGVVGDFYDPLGDRAFDLIVSNPPFVVGRPTAPGYRDSGLAGDQATARVLRDGAARLAPGGMLVALGNWCHLDRARDAAVPAWDARVAEWLADAGVDGWVVQREVRPALPYVEWWLRDAPAADPSSHRAAYRSHATWLQAAGVAAVGFGWAVLRRSAAETVRAPRIAVEDWPHAIEHPAQLAVERWVAALELPSWVDRAAAGESDWPTAAAATRAELAIDVLQETFGAPGADDPTLIHLRQQSGMCRTLQVGTAAGGLLGACDGSVPLGALVGAVAEVLDRPVAAVAAEVGPTLAAALRDGLVTLIDDTAEVHPGATPPNTPVSDGAQRGPWTLG